MGKATSARGQQIGKEPPGNRGGGAGVEKERGDNVVVALPQASLLMMLLSDEV